MLRRELNVVIVSPWNNPISLVSRPKDIATYFESRSAEQAQRDLDWAMRQTEHDLCMFTSSQAKTWNQIKKLFRITGNYKYRNDHAEVSAYPLPSIAVEIDRVTAEGPEAMSFMDSCDGFHNLTITEDSREQTAISTTTGIHLQFTTMPQGIAEGPAIYAEKAKWVNGPVEDIQAAFQDDMLPFTKRAVDHPVALQRIFNRLRETGWMVDIRKRDAKFLVPEVKYLGMVISAEGRRPDPAKVEAILKLAVPRTKSDLKCFLGLTGYQAEYIRSYAEKVAPLTDLLRGEIDEDITHEWDEEALSSFEAIKKELAEEPCLAPVQWSKPFIVAPDACIKGRGIGAVLYQRNKDDVARPVAYYSMKLKPYQRRYCPTEVELLGLRMSVEHWRRYLFSRQFEIWTDHISLTSLLEWPDPHGKLARWANYLRQYRFSVHHRSGELHLDSDAVSRLWQFDDDEWDMDEHEKGTYWMKNRPQVVDDLTLMYMTMAVEDVPMDFCELRRETRNTVLDIYLQRGKVPINGMMVNIGGSRERAGTHKSDFVYGDDDLFEEPLVDEEVEKLSAVSLDQYSYSRATDYYMWMLHRRYSQDGHIYKVVRIEDIPGRGVVAYAKCTDDENLSKEIARPQDPEALRLLISEYELQNQDLTENAWVDEKRLHDAQMEDDEWSTIIGLIASSGVDDEESYEYDRNEFFIKSNLLHRRSPEGDKQICVPAKCVEALLRHYHVCIMHAGGRRMYLTLRKRWYWTHMRRDVVRYTNDCDICKVTKRGSIPEHLRPPIQVNTGDFLASRPFEAVHIDLIGPLPASARYRNVYVFTVCCRLTKYGEAFAMQSKRAEDIADAFFEEIILRYGPPRVVYSDQGSEFCNKLFSALSRLMQSKHLTTTPYTPQSNGQAERFNQTLFQMLRAYMNEEGADQNLWDDYLSCVRFAYNTTINTSTGYTPHLLCKGFEASLPLDSVLTDDAVVDLDDWVENRRRWLLKAWRNVSELLSERSIHYNDSRSTDGPKKKWKWSAFSVGDWVFLSRPPIPYTDKPASKRKRQRASKQRDTQSTSESESLATTRKLVARWSGPYQITAVVSPVVYVVEIGGRKQRLVFCRFWQKCRKTAAEERFEAELRTVYVFVSVCERPTLFFPGERPPGLPSGASKKNRGDVVPEVT